MKEKGLVSVIMSVHNGMDSLNDAVESIKRQTYSNWEFIICDDGSTDGTLNYLLKLEQENSRFIIIKNDTNKGLAYSLNKCIEHCSGEYIARMDADDISYPKRFEKQVDYLNWHPDIAFVSSVVDIYDGDKITSVRSMKEFPTKMDLILGTKFIHPATMFRHEALSAVNGYRVSGETLRGQDYDLFMRMYGHGLKGANVMEALFRYTEDVANFKRRTFKARVGEMKIRIHGYKAMGVLYWAFPFIIKPYIAWLFTFLKRGWE